MTSQGADLTGFLFTLSSRLAGAAGARIGEEVRSALDTVRQSFDADQCAFLKVVNERDAVVMLHRVAIDGVPPVPTHFDYGSTFPATYRAVFRELRPYVLDRLADLPAHETVQRATCSALGLQAIIALPIFVSGSARYSIALGCGGRDKAWPRERIGELQAAGELIAVALEREEEELRVRRSEADLAGAQRVARMGSWSRDLVADHFSVSDEAARILGSRPNSSGEWRECIHPGDRERVADETRAVLGERRTAYRIEYRIVDPGGDVRTIVDQGEVRYHDEGHAASAIGTIQDVTEARRTEQELRELRARIWHADRAARAGALGSSLSHELGQPLAAMLANAEAGLRLIDANRADMAELRDILEAVVRDDKRAVAIIDGLRGLLRKDAQPRMPVDVAAAIGQVIGLLRGELDSFGVDLVAHLAPGCHAMAVNAQLQQVAMNLLSNSLEAMREKPAAGRRLEIVVARRGSRVEVSVSDSGRGLPPEVAQSVFEPFYTTRDAGLGLGLAISRSIVEAHEGRISAGPNDWGGATFRFSLPAMAQPADADESPSCDAPPTGRTTTAANPDAPLVCIVDDDAAMRDSLGRLISSAGYAVALFASGDDLLASAQVARARCAVLDVRLGKLSGPELHQRLARDHPGLAVVFLTAHGDVATGVRAMQQGAVDFLLKPVDGEALVGAVRRAIDKEAAARAQEAARSAARERLGRLSPRERDVLDNVIRGRLNKQIAADLGIAEATVKQHRGRVMEKAGVRSVAELVRLCELAAEPTTKVG